MVATLRSNWKDLEASVEQLSIDGELLLIREINFMKTEGGN
jgi:hypothetical protein